MDNIPRQGFTWAIGQTKVVRFTLSAVPSGSVAGWTLAFDVRKTGLLQPIGKTTGSGIVCTDPTNGVWTVTLPNEDTTDALKLNSRAGLYDFSLWRTDNNSETPLALGTFNLYRTARSG